MAPETVLFKSEERKQLSEVAEFLRQLADRLAQNEVTLRQGEDELTLSIPGQVVLELKVEEEAKRSGNKHSLEIEIEWTEGEAGSSGVVLG
jgi:amphi-Trp domain-containing protein